MHPRIPLEKLALETFSVVLGILLALAANAWHEDRQHQEQAHEALLNFRDEIATNEAALAAHASYHHAIYDSLGTLLLRAQGQPIPGGLRAIKNYDGLSPVYLLDNAWQIAIATSRCRTWIMVPLSACLDSIRSRPELRI